ncbi:MAG TPA: DUF2314 domain-containing protein [Pirellulales bacterium]|nr:DUF2314 domain-containing protein [Pirellulales bacterium]
MSQPSKVYLFDNSDPEMQRAYQNARATFRYFWRELTWERRRIVPALDMACVKAPFSDGEPAARADDVPEVEHMWLDEVEFDGRFVSGELLNDPNWLTTVKKGDSARVALDEISDWMYVIDGQVFGAHTVNLQRSRMGRQQRQEHDDAWGLNFGDPTKIRVAREVNENDGRLKKWFAKRTADTPEHPASENMAAHLHEMLAANPSLITAKDDRGFTALHKDALAGNASIVKILLEAGADRHAVTPQGMTPLELAECLGWEKVVALLRHE